MAQASAVTEIVAAVLASGQQTDDFHSDVQIVKGMLSGRLLATFAAAAVGNCRAASQ